MGVHRFRFRADLVLHLGCLMIGFWIFIGAFAVYCIGWIILGLKRHASKWGSRR